MRDQKDKRQPGRGTWHWRPRGRDQEPMAELTELVVLIALSLVLIVKLIFRPTIEGPAMDET